MESKIYLRRYRVCPDDIGLPIVIRRSTSEATFKAEDLASSQDVAVQVIPVGNMPEAAREKLGAEAALAKELAHANIPALKDFGFEGEQLIYVTEYFEGTTAEEWVKLHGPLPIAAALRVGLQLVGALAAATFHGIYHPALNPANVMLVPGQTPEGEWPLVKLLNFVSVAPNFSTSEATAAGVSEAVNFASPEQLQNGEVDFRSEMYSLGCTLWFLLSGLPPLAGGATVESARNVPESVRELLASMLAVDPDQRPLDPVLLQERMQDCLAQSVPRETVASKLGFPVPPVSAPVEPQTRRALPMKALALAALLVAIAALGAVVLSGHFRSRDVSKIGVPIGVPTSSAAPVVAEQKTVPHEAASVPPATAAASEPPVLTSTAKAPDEEEDASDSASTTAAPSSSDVESTSRVATNERTPPTPEATQPKAVPAKTHEPARIVAENKPARPEAPQPAPPSEGPADNETSAKSEEGEAVTTYAKSASAPNERPAAPNDTKREEAEPVRTEDEEAPRTARASSNESPREKRTIAKAARRTPRRSQEVADSNMPPVPRGAVRAQFLGTTPDGELVFGLPSEERGYVTPRESTRERRARRHNRRVIETVDGVPVLPALPPDE
jgi:serine/threonine protein kinase